MKKSELSLTLSILSRPLCSLQYSEVKTDYELARLHFTHLGLAATIKD